MSLLKKRKLFLENLDPRITSFTWFICEHSIIGKSRQRQACNFCRLGQCFLCCDNNRYQRLTNLARNIIRKPMSVYQRFHGQCSTCTRLNRGTSSLYWSLAYASLDGEAYHLLHSPMIYTRSLYRQHSLVLHTAPWDPA